jgi:hypothetical protein
MPSAGTIADKTSRNRIFRECTFPGGENHQDGRPVCARRSCRRTGSSNCGSDRPGARGYGGRGEPPGGRNCDRNRGRIARHSRWQHRLRANLLSRAVSERPTRGHRRIEALDPNFPPGFYISNWFGLSSMFPRSVSSRFTVIWPPKANDRGTRCWRRILWHRRCLGTCARVRADPTWTALRPPSNETDTATAETQTHAGSAEDHDRHIMRLQQMLGTPRYTRRRVGLPPTTLPLASSRQNRRWSNCENARLRHRCAAARSRPNSRPCCVARSRALQSRPITSGSEPAAKSP